MLRTAAADGWQVPLRAHALHAGTAAGWRLTPAHVPHCHAAGSKLFKPSEIPIWSDMWEQMKVGVICVCVWWGWQ